MKKLLQILPFILFAFSVNAQQTEDDIYVGKGKTFGNYRGTDIRSTKLIKGQSIISGTVIKVDWCEDDCMTVWVKKNDGTIVSVGTKDFGFKVPKNIVGKNIFVEGVVPGNLSRKRETVEKDYQKDIQIAATGIRVYYIRRR